MTLNTFLLFVALCLFSALMLVTNYNIKRGNDFIKHITFYAMLISALGAAVLLTRAFFAS
jgi:hypothetical protein